MAAHADGLIGITTTRAYERTAVDQVVAIAHLTIVELRARLEVARQQLAELEAAAAAGDALATRIGRMVLEAQEQIRIERLEAERTAAAIADAADAVAAAIRRSATGAVAPAPDAVDPDALVVDLTERVPGGELPYAAARWTDERIAAS